MAIFAIFNIKQQQATPWLNGILKALIMLIFDLGGKMPLYEYRCHVCEYQFEALQKINDKALIDCPACDESSLRKLISAAGFRLKGDGWYETDFKSGNQRNLVDNNTNAATESKTSSKSSASSD